MNHYPQSPRAPVIPDHPLANRIERAACGEIWMVNDLIGAVRQSLGLLPFREGNAAVIDP
jgi:hypothetical protein